MTENKYDKIRRDTEAKRKRDELKARYKSDWRFCRQVLPPTNNIPEHLGDLDADIEWSHDERGAYKKFINIEAYNRFTEEKSLILMGRTGTGKSSILNRYAYAVNSGEINDFRLALCIKLERFFEVLEHFEFIEEYKPDSYIQDGIELVVKLCVIHNLVKTDQKEGYWSDRYNDEMVCLNRFLESKNITCYTDIIEEVSKQIDFLGRPGSDLREAILKFLGTYKEIKGAEIENAIGSILSTNKILVLADSVDYYDITEKKVVTINKALVELVFKLCKSHKGIVLKAAIPSEVYTHIIEQIAAKKKTKVITIEWRYKDIIKMLALKVLYFFDKEKHDYVKDFLKYHTIEDCYKYEIALEFLHTMLPKTCSACIPVIFETLPYCIRHTQKKPRQIVNVFNILVDQICQKDEFDYFIHHSDEICNYIHKVQKDIINDALNMYNVIAKQKVLQIVKSVLDKKRNILEPSELNTAIKDALSIIGSIGLSEGDVKQILIESGMVGLLSEENYVAENSAQFKNQNVLKICIALFEYQIKDTLPITKDGKYVLHPMCYEYYANEIDYNMLVYPSPADDDDDDVIMKLELEGVAY